MKKEFYTQFNDQRQNAYKRNIEWQFTYDEWVSWWGTDISNRGKGKGKLCMARKGDCGSYSPENVFKLDFAENVSQAQAGRPSHWRGKTQSIEHRMKNSVAQKANYAAKQLIEEK